MDPEKSRLNDDAKVVIIIQTDKNKYLKENKHNKYGFILYKAFLYNPPVWYQRICINNVGIYLIMHMDCTMYSVWRLKPHLDAHFYLKCLLWFFFF